MAIACIYHNEWSYAYVTPILYIFCMEVLSNSIVFTNASHTHIDLVLINNSYLQFGNFYSVPTLLYIGRTSPAYNPKELLKYARLTLDGSTLQVVEE